MRVYIARPITGCTTEEVIGYYQETSDMLRNMGYEVFHAMCAKTYFKGDKDFKAEGYEQPLSTDHAIVERDRWMTKMADVVFVNLLGAKKVSIGTVMELAWAKDHNKHIVLVMEKENVHYHAFVLESASVIYPTYNEAVDYLHSLAFNLI